MTSDDASTDTAIDAVIAGMVHDGLLACLTRDPDPIYGDEDQGEKETDRDFERS